MKQHDLDEINFTPLGGELADIERDIGRGVALKFAALYGATRLSVPGWEHLDSHHTLVQDFGLETAIKIARAVGCNETYGLVFDVPTATDEFRHRAVYYYVMRGFSANEIMKETGIHRVTVFRYLKFFRSAGILPEDSLDFLSDDQRAWLLKIFTTTPPPKSEEDKSSLARALCVPRSAINAFIAQISSKGTS